MMIISLTDFNVIEINVWGTKDKKMLDLRILDRQAMTDLRATVQVQTGIHIQQTQ